MVPGARQTVPAGLLPVMLQAALASATVDSGLLDLSNATVVLVAPAAPRAAVFARMLCDQVHSRTGLSWRVVDDEQEQEQGPDPDPNPAGPAQIKLSAASGSPVAWRSAAPEGYTIRASGRGEQAPGHPATVEIAGSDERGLLYGVGRLLRIMNMSLEQNYYTPRSAAVSVPAGLTLSSSPDRAMRGLQIG